MTNLVAIIGLLLVIQFTENTSGEVIHVKTGQIASLFGPRSDQLIKLCSVEHNGINYRLYPKSNFTDGIFDYRAVYCLFSIRPITFDHAGEWKIFSAWTSNENPVYTNYTVHVEQEHTRLLPGNTIRGESGKYAYVYFEDYPDDITKCYIAKNINHNEMHKFILGDNGNATLVGLKLYQKCGVRIPINEVFRGEWKLVRESGDYKKRSGIITIIPHLKMSTYEESHQVWRHGSSDIKLIINNIGANSYSEVERPDGKVIPLIDPNNEYSVGEVSSKHAGIWKVRYFSEFSLNPVERRIFVHVIDSPAIKATATTTKDDTIHILCQTYVYKIDYCFFTSPNGTMINALPGIGDEKYVYYGTGYYSMFGTDLAQCGITILQPSSDDYGSWKCTIKGQNSREIMQGFVSVAHLKNDSLPLTF